MTPSLPSRLTLRSLLERAAAHGPRRTALVCEGRSIAYGELVEQVDRLARRLAGMGLRRGDGIAIYLPNLPEWVLVEFAAASLGLVVAVVNPRYRTAEVAQILEAAKPRAIVLAESFGGVDLGAVLREASSRWSVEHVIPVAELDRLPDRDGLATGDDRADLVNLFATSGTTSSPKLAGHDQQGVVRHALHCARAFELGPGSVLLLPVPLAGVFGFTGAMAALGSGATLVLQPVHSTEGLVELMGEHGATHLYGPDSVLSGVLDEAGGRPRSWRWRWGAFANFGGRPLELVRRCEEQAGVLLHGTYGSSECFALMSRWPEHASAEVRAQAGGFLISGEMEVRVADAESGALLRAGEPGELQFRGYNVMREYLGNPAATRAAFTEDGWYRSSDLGQLEADGSFVYLARLKDSLRLHGYLVDPAEIEEQICLHAAVEAAQVVGAQAPGQEEVAVAFVRLRPGADTNTEELTAFSRSRLARHKVPARFLFVDEFPIADGPNGRKVQKARLKDMAQAALGDE